MNLKKAKEKIIKIRENNKMENNREKSIKPKLIYLNIFLMIKTKRRKKTYIINIRKNAEGDITTDTTDIEGIIKD